MRRRDVLLSTLAAGTVGMPALAAPTDTVRERAVLEQVGRLRARMECAGERTVARYRRQLGANTLPERLWLTIRAGLGALSIVPALRRMPPEEQRVPAAQALMLDVAEDAGTYLLHLHDVLAELLRHPDPRPRRAAGDALRGLADLPEDEEFGRSSFVALRSGREAIRAEVGHAGPESLLERVFAHLDGVVTRARAQLAAEPEPPPPVDGAPRQTVGAMLARGLATLVGLALLAGAAVGAVLLLAAGYGVLTQPECAVLWLITAIVGGVLLVTAGSAGLGMLAAGRPTGVRRSIDGKHITVTAVASWKWFATGATFGATQPKVLVEGAVRPAGSPLKGVGPGGRAGSAADDTAPAPGLPEYALVARVGDWIGLVWGTGEVLASAPRQGELWLAVNAPAEATAATEGAFRVSIRL